MWAFAVLLVLAAGMFPLQAVIGQGASETAWRSTFFGVFAAVTALTVILTRGWYWQILSLTSLLWIGLWAYQFQKIGVAFMPALDEGTLLDMPITVPRASITQAVDDLKARDALLRSFPEVESVIGKAGRADTPTDPAPLDMVETFVNFRPKELWPKRVIRYSDAAEEVGHVLATLEDQGFVKKTSAADNRASLINDAAQRAIERFDETQRELALLRYSEFEQVLGPQLVRFAMRDCVKKWKTNRSLDGAMADHLPDEEWTDELNAQFGVWLAESPSLEDITGLVREYAVRLEQAGQLSSLSSALELKESPFSSLLSGVRESMGAEPVTFSEAVLQAVADERMRLWREQVKQINWELFDFGSEAFVSYAMEEIIRVARSDGLLAGAPHETESQFFADASIQAQLGRLPETSGSASAALAESPFTKTRNDLIEHFRTNVFFWPRQTGPKGDLVDDEMSRVLQVPGWSNIFTQPIINRIEMLSTGVRTDIGVKVFGPDLNTIDRVCKDIEAALKPISGSRDVIAAPIMGKGYLQIDIDRKAAARYGISVEDIQNEIEVALAGRTVTCTVEKRDRFPVRVRYARVNRDDEESIRRLLVSSSGMSNPGSSSMTSGMGSSSSSGTSMPAGSPSTATNSTDHRAGGAFLNTFRITRPCGAVSH
ncbi:MAG: efflux RND transporter permease subunit [Planctomycetaceae bacterium]